MNLVRFVVAVLSVLAGSLLLGREDWADELAADHVVHVIVSGEVRVPGRYEVAAESASIGSLLAQAGNVTGMAAEAAYIERADESGQIKRYPVSLLDPVRLHETGIFREGDKLVVRQALEYSIVGEVKKPGPYRLDPNQTMTQALAKAGGGTVFANQRRFEIQRKRGDGTVIVQAQADDFVEPGDVIRVKIAYF